MKKAGITILAFVFLFVLALNVEAANPYTVTESLSLEEGEYEARIFKVKNKLIAVSSNDDGAKAYLYSNQENDWNEINAEITDDTNNTKITTITVFRNKVYLALKNETTGAEVWQLTRPNKALKDTGWNQTNEDGFGDGSNTEITRFWKLQGILYAGVKDSVNEVAKIYKSEDGLNWEQVGSDGLNMTNEVVEITAARIYKDEVVYVSTADGRVLTSSLNDLENWEVDENFEAKITDMAKYRGKMYVGVKDGDGAKLYRTTGDGEYTQVNEDGFGDSNNTEISKIVNKNRGGSLLVFTKNTESGLQAYTSLKGKNDWGKKFTDGFGDSNNTMLTDAITYKNSKYLSTYNEAGAKVYKVTKTPIAPVVTSPEDGDEVSDDSLAVTGQTNATLFNKKIKVKFFIDDEYQDYSFLEEDGSFSKDLDISGLEAGEYELQVRTVINKKVKKRSSSASKNDNGNGKNNNKNKYSYKKKLGKFTAVNFTVTQ